MANEIKWQDAFLYPPDRLAIQATNVCNADCIFCGYQYLKDEKSFLKDEHFYKAVDQYAKMGGRIIDFTPLVGDLLIDPKIFEKLNYVRDKGTFKKVKFYTNGILLDRKGYPEKLLESLPTFVTFSAPGFDEEMYKRVYRSNSYKKMLRGTHKFLKLNKEKGWPIRASFTLKPDRPKEESVFTRDYKEYIEPYLENNSLYYVGDLDNWGGSIKQSDLTGNMKLAEEIALEKKGFPCYFTFFLSLMVDGHVRLCGCRFNNGTEYDELIVGHIGESSLLEIWQSDKVKEIRKNFIAKKLVSVCQSCTHYAPYSGNERAEYKIEEYKKVKQ